MQLSRGLRHSDEGNCGVPTSGLPGSYPLRHGFGGKQQLVSPSTIKTSKRCHEALPATLTF